MDNSALGTVIAERYFEARQGDRQEYEVVLRIGTPIRDPRPEGDWYCPYQIMGVPNSKVRAAFGIDSLQAFLLALQKARAELDFNQRANSLRFTWLDQDDWGFPGFET
jgi:hypothetical protein